MASLPCSFPVGLGRSSQRLRRSRTPLILWRPLPEFMRVSSAGASAAAAVQTAQTGFDGAEVDPSLAFVAYGA